MTKNLRLKDARIKSGLSQSDLAKKLGVNPQYINMLEDNKGYSYKKAKELSEILNVSADWLFFGRNNAGEMEPPTQEGTKIIPIRKEGVPYYDIDVTLTVARSFSDVQEEPEYYVDYKPFNDCTAFLPVYGNSMFPMFASGETVAVKQIFNLDAILWGEAYLIITDEEANNLRTIKLLFPVDGDSSRVILRASNPSFKGDTVIKKESILSLYAIRGKVTRFVM